MSQRIIFITLQDMDRLRALMRKSRDPLGLDRPLIEPQSCRSKRSTRTSLR